MRFLLALTLLVLGLPQLAPAAKPEAKEAWLNGSVIAEGQALFFQTDRPVKNNSAGNLLILSVPNNLTNLLPALFKAAEKKIPLRLYGSLNPFAGTLPNHQGPLPSLQFVIWKIHLPGEPDDLPEAQRVDVPSHMPKAP